MAVEHRWYPRHEVICSALLYHCGELISACRIDNISLDGMFVSLPDVPLHCGDRVDVVFNTGRSKARLHYCAATIVHRGHNGFGLMCMDANPFYVFDSEGPRKRRASREYPQLSLFPPKVTGEKTQYPYSLASASDHRDSLVRS